MHGDDKRLVDNVLVNGGKMTVEAMVKLMVELKECHIIC